MAQLDRLYHYDPPAVAANMPGLAIQRLCLKRLEVEFPSCKAAAVPNGARRTKFERGQAIAEGMRKGFPDLIIMGGRGRTAFVEIKGWNDSVSKDQHDWLTWMCLNVHPCAVIRSQDTFADFLIRAGFPSRRIR